jgi:hypothetical protein
MKRPARPIHTPKTRWLRRALTALVATAAVSVLSVGGAPAPAGAAVARQAGVIYHDPPPEYVVTYVDRNGRKPYMGWSSWSLQTSRYPGLNPRGDYSWLTEAHVLEQGAAMGRGLRRHGYRYINIDAGWWRKWDWTPEYDQYGRPAIDAERFPHGIAYVARKLHARGLRVGIYMPVGLEKGAYDNGDFPIYGAPGCSTHDIVYPDLRTTNGWDSSYKIDFSTPCAQYYLDSIAHEFASWKIDFLKVDGVGPGSERSGPNYDNTRDVRAWATALAGSGRRIRFELSWALNHDDIATWQRWSNGWRVDIDVECYCDTLVQWAPRVTKNSVSQRFSDVLPWTGDAGPGGWNDLDSLDVGNGAMDGITEVERQTYMTLWAIEAAPLYSGDDLTQLDTYGRSLLTNDEVIAIDQAGVPARPVSTATPQQVWSAKLRDGSYVVALFNLDATPATVTAQWADLGFSGPTTVRDVWQHTPLGAHGDAISAQLPGHGSALYRVRPSHRH